MRPPGFNQPNVQSNQGNQSRYQGNNFNQNRRGNFNQNRQNNQGAVYQTPPYQPPTNQPLVNQVLPPVSQIQGVSKTDFESYAKANDANMNNLQMKLDNFQRAITNAPSSTSSPSNNSFKIQQMAALLEDKMNIRMSRLEKAITEKNATTPAIVKAVEEVCVTCGSNYNFNNCPLTRNEFPVFHDNIQQFQQTATVGNFVQRNPPNLAYQMRPPGFNQPNVQNNQGNQSRYQGNNFNLNQNRGGNFNQNPQNNQGAVYQTPPSQPPTNQPLVNQVLPPVSQIQGVSKSDFEKDA
ncbi:hypothetical protein Tco_0061132 [Tanacetum coccineum]